MQLQKNLKHEGKSLQSLRQQIAEQIMLSRVQLALLPDENKPTQNDVKRWLKANQYKGLAFQLIDWHIPSESMPKNAAKETAESWFKLLRDAKAVVPSVIPGVQKHVMKLRAFADLPTLFAHALVKAKFNKTVGPILADNGYHVLQVVAKRGQVFTSDTAYQYLVGEAVEQHLPAILAKLKAEAYIQKFND